MTKQETEKKIERILQVTLEVLSKNGYENTTINDIADAAGISRGLLHYYFKDKEDMVAKALSYGFEPMWDASVANIAKAKSLEQLIDNMINVLKTNVRDNPDFTALLFEMWVSGRRSSKIRRVFNEGMTEAVNRLVKLLQLASAAGVVKISPSEAEGVVRVLLGLYHGLAMQLLADPDKAKDHKLWAPVRKMLLVAFQ